jgi:hypothetical protein
MAISTAAALIGSAVIGGGVSYLNSKNAAKKAANAANYAADQNAAVSREIYQQTRSDLSPYNQAGQAGLSALLTRLGIPTGPQAGAAPAGNPAAANKAVGGMAGTSPMAAPTAAQPTGGGSYIQANPDVMAEFQRLSGTPEGQAQLQAIGATTPEAFGNYHYQTFGQYEGREPPAAPAMQPGEAAAPPMTPQQEAAQFGERPADMPVPQFGPTPTFQAPNWQDIQNDPGFQWETGQAAKGVNAYSAARGKLRSGDAAKELQDRAYGVAHSYGQDYFNRALQSYDRNYNQALDQRSFDANWWNTQQGRRDNIFSEDRGFTAGRYDQGTANLFGLVGVGQNAAAGTANAGNVFASNVINSNNQRAAATGNAAIANAANMNNLFGSALGAAGMYYGSRR